MVVVFAVHPVAGLLAPVPLVGGWLAARRSLHASDVGLLGVAGVVLVGVWWHKAAWDESSLYLVPVLLVAGALLAREAWDLSTLRAAMDAQRRPPAAGGAVPGPSSRRAAARGMLLATLVVGAGVLLAWLLGLTREGVRDAYADLGGSAVRSLALVAFVGALGGVVWLVALWRRGQTEA